METPENETYYHAASLRLKSARGPSPQRARLCPLRCVLAGLSQSLGFEVWGFGREERGLVGEGLRSFGSGMGQWGGHGACV